VKPSVTAVPQKQHSRQAVHGVQLITGLSPTTGSWLPDGLESTTCRRLSEYVNRQQCHPILTATSSLIPRRVCRHLASWKCCVNVVVVCLSEFRGHHVYRRRKGLLELCGRSLLTRSLVRCIIVYFFLFWSPRSAWWKTTSFKSSVESAPGNRQLYMNASSSVTWSHSFGGQR